MTPTPEQVEAAREWLMKLVVQNETLPLALHDYRIVSLAVFLAAREAAVAERLKAERRALVEAGVRAGMEWAGAGKGRPTGTTISLPPDLTARVLAEFDKEET